MQEASHVIHVVDDDSSFRCAMARLLNAAGYSKAAKKVGYVFY